MKKTEGGQADDQKAMPRLTYKDNATSISNDSRTSAVLWQLSLILRDIAEQSVQDNTERRLGNDEDNDTRCNDSRNK
jgi:hypothetical protein